ncbi:WhiB family transcriptional regulator [Blastococcus atacamensis]|nr:WhiB family transcriptional regulator [Blastococcus atacamensis]
MPSFSRPALTLVHDATASHLAYAEPLWEAAGGWDDLTEWDAETQWDEPAAPAESVWPEAVPATGEEWRLDALCAETDPEAFFPEKGGSTRDAKRVCTGCPVRAQCLEFALANDERFGIWGGLSERERRRVRVQRNGSISA